MVGYARLKRSKIIVETLPSVNPKRWSVFKDVLDLDSPLEFNEGDVGIAGGLQVEEPAGMHPTTVDTIKRVGGTTSPLAQWPEETEEGGENDDRLGKIEQMIKRAVDQLQTKKTKLNHHGQGSNSGRGSAGAGSGSGGDEGYEEEEQEE
eukprot:TRINITY_DN12424_c0_g4_i1.p1 TRINITY_DN12424_c0_g4~~TRINITY_DN12424_c0_g4_i1.p1  ORF type:complete len:167 (+),score=53.64 TRINITY_DN12424_c0_g4_i1:57-503(+)